MSPAELDRHATARRYAGHERALAIDPANDAAREAMLDVLFALNAPPLLPGCSLGLPWGADLPRVAVVTPYYREPLYVLQRCAASVRAQTVPAIHVMVADGYPQSAIDAWPVRHIKFSRNNANFGDTPRARAGEVALELGCTAVAYLDADNWWRPRHLESLIARHVETGAHVCHSARTLHASNGALMPLLESGDNTVHVDTNCILVTEKAFDLLARWGGWPKPLSIIGDRMFWAATRSSGAALACTGALTAAYTADRAGHYRALGWPVPANARSAMDFSGVLHWYDSLGDDERRALDRAQGFEVGALLDARRPRSEGTATRAPSPAAPGAFGVHVPRVATVVTVSPTSPFER
ncbi:MAG: glycosyltransferase [Pseudomonadota bacterium]|nr:glycosyltransferase [Pseudomonadota bacterium]